MSIVIAGFFSLFILNACDSDNNPKFNASEQEYIAHGGGDIDGHLTTNSREAVEHTLKHGISYVELDLALTSDSVLVALHDWATFRKLVGKKPVDSIPMSLSEFKETKILGVYSPLTGHEISRLLKANPRLRIVTDKISDHVIIDRYFHDYRDRVIVECFTEEDYHALDSLGYTVYLSKVPPPYLYNLLLNMVGKERNVHRYAGNLEIYLKRKKSVFISPRQAEVILYSCRDRETADSIFKNFPEVKMIYVDYVEK